MAKASAGENQRRDNVLYCDDIVLRTLLFVTTALTGATLLLTVCYVVTGMYDGMYCIYYSIPVVLAQRAGSNICDVPGVMPITWRRGARNIESSEK